MDFEALIVGGAMAGASAALVLGRCGRRVLVCDDGHPRNAAARGVHGFLTRDGLAPAEFLRVARREVLVYPSVTWWDVRVEAVERLAEGFRLRTSDGRTATGATVLLATGLVDELPEIPGVRQFWGRGVYVCPFCDAWEVRGRRFVVLGRTPDLYDFVLELRQWSQDLVIATDGAWPFSAEQAAHLERLGLPLLRAKVVALEGQEERLERVRLADGTVLDTSVVFLTTTQHQRSPLADQLGCPPEPGGAVPVRESDCAAADRVWVAGNASTGLQMAVIAAAEGVKAAHAINERLVADGLRGT